MGDIASADGPTIERFLTPTAIGASVALGVAAFLVAGVMPVMLGALADAHRLTTREMGMAATGEPLAMALTNALFGFLVKPKRLRLIGVLAVVMLAILDICMTRVSGVGVILVRTVSGAPEGVLLWILVGGMIARARTPERWFGVMFFSTTVTQLALSAILAAIVMPRFGVDGAFLAIAAVRMVGVVAALLAPDQYDPLPAAVGGHSLPPPRGWAALAATLIFIASGASVAVFLVPLAHQAGLDAGVARVAISALIGAQIVGSALSTVLAGRVHYLTVFGVGAVLTLGAWVVYGASEPAWLFIAASAVLGFIGILMNPFLLPMTNEADPSHRAVVQSGAAQLLGLALGPLLAVSVVSEHDVRGALFLGAALLLLGLAMMVGLRLTGRPA